MQDPRSVLQTMILERNKCAHESSYTVSNLSVRPVPGQVIQFALAADIAMSVAAERMRLADVNFYQTISGSHTAGSDFAMIAPNTAGEFPDLADESARRRTPPETAEVII
jgi:hypothetical protein